MGYANKTRSHYKIRPITIRKKSNVSYGLNVPKEIAMQFYNVSFSIQISGNNIIYTSGLCPFAKEVKVER